MVLVLAFVTAVSATIICEVDCVTQALAQGQGQHTADSHAAGTDSHGPGAHGPLKDAGACHLATQILAASSAATAALGLREDQWLSVALLAYASVIWPPPRPRPKLIVS